MPPRGGPGSPQCTELPNARRLGGRGSRHPVLSPPPHSVLHHLGSPAPASRGAWGMQATQGRSGGRKRDVKVLLPPGIPASRYPSSATPAQGAIPLSAQASASSDLPAPASSGASHPLTPTCPAGGPESGHWPSPGTPEPHCVFPFKPVAYNKTCSLTPRETRSPQSQDVGRVALFPYLFQLPGASGHSWSWLRSPSLSAFLTPTPTPASLYPLLSLTETAAAGCRAHLDDLGQPHGQVRNGIISAKTPFPNKVTAIRSR